MNCVHCSIAHLDVIDEFCSQFESCIDCSFFKEFSSYFEEVPFQ